MLQTKSRIRQLEFRFEENRLWQEIPKDERRRCVELLARLLGDTIRIEIEGRKKDEREDQS